MTGRVRIAGPHAPSALRCATCHAQSQLHRLSHRGARARRHPSAARRAKRARREYSSRCQPAVTRPLAASSAQVRRSRSSNGRSASPLRIRAISDTTRKIVRPHPDGFERTPRGERGQRATQLRRVPHPALLRRLPCRRVEARLPRRELRRASRGRTPTVATSSVPDVTTLRSSAAAVTRRKGSRRAGAARERTIMGSRFGCSSTVRRRVRGLRDVPPATRSEIACNVIRSEDGA